MHGLWLRGGEMWILRRRLSQYGFEPHVFHYRTVMHGIERSAASLEKFVSGVSASKIHLVGYSLGGVIAVEMLRRSTDSRIGRLVCIGSPLAGTATGRAMARLPIGRALVGKSIVELNQRGGVGPWTGDVEIGVIAGTMSFGAGLVVGGLQSANDGTVAVAETKIDGLKDHVIRHLTHTSMMFSAKVAADIAQFLRTGKFER